MKTIKVNKTKLYPTLYRLYKVIKGRRIDDILKNFSIQAEGEVMCVTASNDEISIREEVDILTNFEGEVDFLVDAGTIAGFVAKLSGDIKIKIKDDLSSIKVEHESGSFVMPCQKGYMYRRFGYPSNDCNIININGGIVYEMIEAVKYAVDHDDTSIRPVLRNIYMDILEDKTILVASDGFEFRYSEVKIKSEKKCSFMITPSLAEGMAEYIKNNDNVTIKIDENRVFILSGGVVISGILPYGAYANYASIVEKCNDEKKSCEFHMATKKMIEHLERVEVATERLVNIDIKDGSCVMSNDTYLDNMRIEEKLSPSFVSGAMNNNFSLKRLKAIIKTLDGEVVMKKHSEMRCLYIDINKGDIYFKYILMSYQTN